MKQVLPALVVGVLAAFQAAANPNEAPDIRPLAEARLEDGYRVVELNVTHEDLRRDGLDASYYGEFEASVAVPVALFHEIGRGEGYVLVGKVIDRGETVPAVGNAVAAWQDGRWLVEVNILDLRLPGGSPFTDFRYRSPNMVVLEAGTEQVERFQAQREAGIRDTEALRMQEVRLKDAELRLEDQLRREREVLAAQREVEAKAAQELAEIEAARKVAEARTAMVAEREASLKASDELIFPLLGGAPEHSVQVTHEGRRVEGTLRITDNGASHAAGTLNLALGNGEFHEAPIAITGAAEPGQVMARYSRFNHFQRGNYGDCLIQGTFSDKHRIMSVEGDPENRKHGGCHTDRIVVDLSAER